MNWLTVLSPLSAWLVMLALSARAANEPSLPFRHMLTLRHVLWAYALPALLILLLHGIGLIDRLASLGLLICLLSGCGTSGAALARASRYNQVDNYVEQADAQMCLLVQAETTTAIANRALCHDHWFGPAPSTVQIDITSYSGASR